MIWNRQLTRATLLAAGVVGGSWAASSSAQTYVYPPPSYFPAPTYVYPSAPPVVAAA